MSEKIEKAREEISSYLGEFFSMIGEYPTLGIEAKPPDELYVDIQGESDFFSEDREELVRSLSTLVEVLIERQCNLDRDVQIDINGVKLTRRKNLEQFALEAAEKALEKSRKVRLNPMPAVERKWVHITLNGIDGVETYSVGEGEDRRVIIKPKQNG
ncbi:MAG: protein jag [Candidatus Bipolaricaulota bacterium]